MESFAATRSVVCEGLTPGIYLGVGDLFPAESVPGAKVHLNEGVIDVMMPPPKAKLTSNSRAALQGRGVYHAWPSMQAGGAANAMGQALGLATVYRQVGATDATPLSTHRTRVAPGDHRGSVR